ncbi:uncharacterized protein SRS1_25015 [Sporisorium reilianum f. sp. reilianum]|uniref:Uncharacterized protein n=1 Tax=Sporisorium reilianum f. sp. reilianum TaxID=72559 RepID=A0A2N8UJK9_9BASI|nr:uncharacterized protein SRS1_25015 [Sporisorium reilianum f. sp. reilianum]
MLEGVKEKKVCSLKATGANFNKDKAYATLYNLVDLYNASKIKLSFLKPAESLAAHKERIQRQKQKQVVSQAREAGQMGQTLALQRLQDRTISSMPSDILANNSPNTLEGEDENDDAQSSASQLTSPAQKRHKTHKMQIGETLISMLDKLVNMQAKALSRDERQATSPSPSADVDKLKDQVSQLQSDMAGMNQKIDALLQMVMQQSSCQFH